MKTWITKNGYQIHQLLGGRINAFSISNGSRVLLVDTGRTNKWGILTKRIDKICRQEGSLDALILTHSHFDHAENAAYIKEKYKAPIIVQHNEAGFLEKGNNPAIAGSFFLTKWVTDLWGRKIESYFHYKPAEWDILVDDRYDLTGWGFNAYIMHTPGHTAGSMSIIVDNEIALAGDAIFGIFKWSVFTPFADQPKLMVKSWGKLLDTGCTIFLPAHGTAVSRELLQKEYDTYRKKL